MFEKLILSSIQKLPEKAFKFESTGINVYSLEEALYHCYIYWKESFNDFLSDEFILWVKDELLLSKEAAKIKAIRQCKSVTERITKFLSVIYYFDQNQIEKIKNDISLWENRKQWEKFKEQGDSLVNIGDFEQAVLIYKKALYYDEKNVFVLNNIGISYMKLGKYSKAIESFSNALDFDVKNIQIIFNLAEAYIFNMEFDNAEKYIKIAEQYGADYSLIYYFYGEIYLGQKQYKDAINYFEKSLKLSKDRDTVIKLSDTYVKLRQFSDAVNVFNGFVENTEILVKKSEIYVMENNIPASIRCIERALLYEKDNIKLWVMLAKYYRLNYDFKKADAAICKAINISKGNLYAKLEFAKIQKAEGKLKDYQNALREILYEFKQKYRKIYL